MRRSVAAAVVLLGMYPLGALALGLGEITLKSALNEPFLAEIPLESYSAAELESFSAGLASADAFARYGLEIPGFMQDFRFDTVLNPSGAAVIRISSQRPVPEPFVTVLLDARWSAGRLLREYTVLLDPPVFSRETAPVAVAPVRAGAAVSPVQPAPAATPAPPPVPFTPEPVAASSGPTGSPAPVRGSVPTAEPGIAAGSYTVQRRDTLWEIANRVRADSGLTNNQVMLALYQANPEAFSGNINRLKAGAILRVPPASDMSLLSVQEANAQVRAQNEQLAAGVGAASVAPAATLELVPPVSTAGRDPSGSSAIGAAGATGTAGMEASQQRISELEQALGESQRLLQIRDSELQALQRRLADLEQVTADRGAEVPAESRPFADEVIQQPRLPLPGEVDAELPVTGDEAAVMVDESVAEAGSATAPVTATRPDPVQVAQSSTQPQPSLFAALLGNIWMWVSAAVVLVLALLLARRRRQTAAAPALAGAAPRAPASTPVADHAATVKDLSARPRREPDIVVEEEDDSGDTRSNDVIDFPGAQDSVADIFGVDPSADVESPLEKTISTGAPLNLDQADPIAEAEFHMAYGLYDQAADLLERALRSQPENRSFLTKLLEVYFVWENRDGFLRHARTLQQATGGAADADWNKALILGKQLCPDDPMFVGVSPAAGVADSIDIELTSDGEDSPELDFTLGGTEVRALDADAPDEDEADNLDIDFGDFGTDITSGIELDLGDETGLDAGADTMESPTVQFADEGTAEIFAEPNEPTVESESLLRSNDAGSTMETPTLESPLSEPTLESPTLESMGAGGATSEMPALDPADFDLSELDMSGLEQPGGTDDLDVDLGGLTDDDATLLASLDDIDDATLLANVSADTPSGIDAPGNRSDTVQQPRIQSSAEDTAEQPAIGADLDLDMDLDIEEGIATAVARALPGDSTMTEVGTKLDLARAYIDMGDPDGARSILNEVLEEGGTAQQQEARQLLGELGD